MSRFVQVDPRLLHVPSTRMQGADPYKLQRQIAKFGASLQGMPALVVVSGKNGDLQILNGVTRATRAAKLSPGTTILVEIIDDLPNMDLKRFPRIGDLIP